MSCDLRATDREGPHYQGDIFDVVGGHRDGAWDLIIAHPPCTHLAVSGAKHFKEKIADGRQGQALDFVRKLMSLPIEKICIENVCKRQDLPRNCRRYGGSMGIRRARKEAYANGYRSKFELDISKWFDKNGVKYEYEKCRIKYVVPETIKTYTPDWTLDGNYSVLLESKGFFTGKDRKKMLLVRESNPTLTIRMLFQNASIRLSKTSKTTYSDWCDKNNIEWCDWRKGIPKAWLKTKSIK